MADETNLDSTTNPAKISTYFEETLQNYGLEFSNQNDFYRYTIKKGMKYMLQVAYYVPELSPATNELAVVPAFDVRDEDIHFTPARLWNAVVKNGTIRDDWHKGIKYQIVIYELIRGQHPKTISSLSGQTPSNFESNLSEMMARLNSLAGETT